MLATTRRINWLPEHNSRRTVRNFLETNVDLGPLARALTGARRCRFGSAKKTGYMEAVANYDELLAKPGSAAPTSGRKPSRPNPICPTTLKIHNRISTPSLRIAQGAGQGGLRRVPVVIDCGTTRAHALRAVGISAQEGSRARAFRPPSSRRLFISEAESTRPRDGFFTASWRFFFSVPYCSAKTTARTATPRGRLSASGLPTASCLA